MYENSITILNQARAMELHAIFQYMANHSLLESLGYRLSKSMKQIAVQEMRHSEMLSVRIRELGGIPTTAPNEDVKDLESVHALYPEAVALENATIVAYGQFIAELETGGDYVSAQLLRGILVDETSHSQYFLNVADDIVNFDAAYLANQAKGKYCPSEYAEFIKGGRHED